jgi:hypothetical protein
MNQIPLDKPASVQSRHLLLMLHPLELVDGPLLALPLAISLKVVSEVLTTPKIDDSEGRRLERALFRPNVQWSRLTHDVSPVKRALDAVGLVKS